MPKQLFLAPAASGKTDATIQLARETSVSVHEVRICVPTGLQARAWQSRLAAAGGALGIHVLTFDRLVAACLNGALRAWNLSSPNARPINFVGISDTIKSISFIEDKALVYLAPEQRKYMTVSLPEYSMDYSLALPQTKVKDMLFAHERLLINLENDGLHCYNPVGLHFVKHIMRHKNVIALVHDEFLLATENSSAKRSVICYKFE